MMCSQQDFTDFFNIRHRSYQRWEKGDSPVPEPVAEQLNDLRSKMNKMLNEAMLLIRDKKPDQLNLIIYASDQDFATYQPDSFEDLKLANIHKSVIEMVAAASRDIGIDVSIVELDVDDYETWLEDNNIGNCSAVRARWAGKKTS